jgi:peptide/nickel transport system substrate-binding protein
MMPERSAQTPPDRAVTEMVGSGPFRFLAGERMPGARNVYAKFDRYLPREGTVSSTAGPHGSPHLEWGANEKSTSVWQYRI